MTKSKATSNGQTQAQKATPDDKASPVTSKLEQMLQKAIRQAEQGNCERALELLDSSERDMRVLNARGVCLMRLGRLDDAVRLYRTFVLQLGATWMRRDLPAVYKVNYATSLLLAGHISGCQQMLAEVGAPQYIGLQRVREAMKRWEKSLNLWQKLNWKFGRIEPKNRPVHLDFPPGDFLVDITTPETPSPSSPNPPLRTAA